MWIFSFPTPFSEKTTLSLLCILKILAKNRWPFTCGAMSELSILFHQSVCLFLCPFCPVLITKALEYSLKSRCVKPPALFVLQLYSFSAGDIQTFCGFMQILGYIFFNFCKICPWNFDRN